MEQEGRKGGRAEGETDLVENGLSLHDEHRRGALTELRKISPISPSRSVTVPSVPDSPPPTER
jgi:hypothetical protein